MRTERNDFQRLMDAQLGNIQWDESKSQAVRRRLRQGAAPRRLPRYGLAFAALALALCVATVSILNHAPQTDVVTTQPVDETLAPIQLPDTRAQAIYQARSAVMEQYGLTLFTLGLFRDTCQLTDTGWVVTFETTGLVNRHLAGVYTVEKSNGFITASWTHDDVDKSIWQGTTELNTTAWGQQQLLYARGEGVREATAISREQNALDGEKIDDDYIEGTELWGDPLHDVEPTENDLTVAQATVFAQEAFQQQFGLDASTLTTIEGNPFLSEATLRESGTGIRVWVFYQLFFAADGNFDIAICINAQTGQLERLEYTTLSNG